MANHKKLSVRVALVAVGTLTACVGGGGSLADGVTTWDSAPSSLERTGTDREGPPGFLEGPAASQERAAVSSEPAPGAAGGSVSTFDCSGAYTCREDGKKSSDTIRLRRVNGVCTLSGNGSVSVVLGNDGTLTVNGTTIGTWSVSGSGFSVVSSEGRVTCTRGASDDDDDDDDDVSSSSSGGGTSPGSPGEPPVVLDAGSPSGRPDDG